MSSANNMTAKQITSDERWIYRYMDLYTSYNPSKSHSTVNLIHFFVNANTAKTDGKTFTNTAYRPLTAI